LLFHLTPFKNGLYTPLNLSTTTITQKFVKLTFMDKLLYYLGQISWGNPTWDIFLIVFVAVIAILYGLFLGRDKLMLIFVCLYMSLAITNVAPWLRNLPPLTTDQLFILKSGIFIGVVIILFLLLSRSTLYRTIANTPKHSGLTVIIFSILHVGLVVSVILSFMPSAYEKFLGPLTQKLFVSETAQFLWVVIPIIMMAITARHQKIPTLPTKPAHGFFQKKSKTPF